MKFNAQAIAAVLPKLGKDEPETFRQYIARKILPYKAPTPKLAWDKENRGEGIWPGKNKAKRDAREAQRVDRLAHIRHERVNGNTAHVPKMKHVPRDIFE